VTGKNAASSRVRTRAALPAGFPVVAVIALMSVPLA
jgi:hypothetical protein